MNPSCQTPGSGFTHHTCSASFIPSESPLNPCPSKCGPWTSSCGIPKLAQPLTPPESARPPGPGELQASPAPASALCSGPRPAPAGLRPLPRNLCTDTGPSRPADPPRGPRSARGRRGPSPMFSRPPSRVFGLDIQGRDCGDEAAQWFTDFLKTEAFRLVQFEKNMKARPSGKILPGMRHNYQVRCRSAAPPCCPRPCPLRLPAFLSP